MNNILAQPVPCCDICCELQHSYSGYWPIANLDWNERLQVNTTWLPQMGMVLKALSGAQPQDERKLSKHESVIHTRAFVNCFRVQPKWTNNLMSWQARPRLDLCQTSMFNYDVACAHGRPKAQVYLSDYVCRPQVRV